MTTTAQAALQVPGAEVLTLAVVKPRDPANADAEVPVGIAREDFWTDPADSLPSFPFRGIIAEGSGITVSEYLTRAGGGLGASEIGRGSIEIDSPTASQDDWANLDWNGAEITFYIGARRRADGALMTFAEFDAFPGVVERMDALGDKAWSLSFADPRAALEQPATVKFYRGFGGGFQILGDEVSAGLRIFLESTGNAGVTIAPPFTIEVIGKLTDASFLGTTLFGINDFELFIDSASRIGASFNSLANAVTSGYVVSVGDPFYAALTVEADGVTAKIYAGKDADDTLVVASYTVPLAVASAAWTLARIGGVSGAASGASFEVWEARLWSVVKTQEELEDLGDGPVTDAADRADLVESWRLSEGAELGTGTAICFGEKGVADFDPVGTGTPTWVSSYEGDDPDQFPGSPAGQTKARTWGLAKNVKLVQVDSQRPAFTWQHVDVAGELDAFVEQLRRSGVPMVRDHSITSDSAGQLVFDAATSTVTLTSWSNALDFRLFIPGQASPARLGQRVVISNTASNNGIRRVAVAGISENGLVMQLTDGAVVDESAASGAKIESHPADIQFEGKEFGAFADGLPARVELTGSLTNPSGGDITADFMLLDGLPDNEFVYSSARWTILHATISGKSVNSGAVSFNPVFGYHLPAGDGKTQKDVLDALARSAFGWWIERADGSHDLGTWLPPSGTPVASLDKQRLVDVRPVTSALPHGKFEIEHTPIWYTQNGDALAGSVSAGDRKRWSEPYTIKPVVNRRIRDDRFPLSQEIPRLTTYLSESDGISAFEALARPFFFLEPRWFRLVFADLWPLFIQRNDVVEVTWDDDALGLDATLCRVTGREINTGEGTMEIECFFLKSEPI